MKMARVLAVSCSVLGEGKQPPEARLAANRRMVHQVLERAALFRPDIVLLPELILQAGCGDFKTMARFAEAVPDGETCRFAAAKARQLQAHVVLPLLEREGDRVYNTAVLLGRDGSLLGRYHKYHATGSEILAGVTPGTPTAAGSASPSASTSSSRPSDSNSHVRPHSACSFPPCSSGGNDW